MNNIWITVKKELRGIVRDKKSLLMMLVTPIMIPLFMILFSGVYDSQLQEVESEEKEYTIGINYALSPEEESIIKELHLKIEYYDNLSQLEKAYSKKKIPAYIVKEETLYTIYSNSADTDSLESSALGSAYLEQYNSYLGHKYLSDFDVDFEQVDHSIQIEVKELEGSSEFVNMILFFGVIFSIMAISLTAVYGVTDTIAGEKERGTLETILTFPIKSRELITGKYLAISISCIITSIISTILVLVSTYVSKQNFTIFDGAVLNINFLTVLFILLLMVSYSFFVSGVCIVIASFTKSYKEAQSALTPVTFMTMIPMIMNTMEISFSIYLAFVPVISHTMLINDIITLGVNGDIVFKSFVVLISTAIYSWLLVTIISGLYKDEKILFSN